MEAMELRRHYRSIYLAGPSFNLLPDDDTAWRALARIRAHLEPDGSALIPLFVPAPVPDERLGRAAHPRGPTTAPRCGSRAVAVERDDAARLQTTRHCATSVSADGEVERARAVVGAALVLPGRLPAARERRGHARRRAAR